MALLTIDAQMQFKHILTATLRIWNSKYQNWDCIILGIVHIAEMSTWTTTKILILVFAVMCNFCCCGCCYFMIAPNCFLDLKFLCKAHSQHCSTLTVSAAVWSSSDVLCANHTSGVNALELDHASCGDLYVDAIGKNWPWK